MRWTQSLIPTLRENPADAQILSHQLLLRAGFVRQVTAGVYDFLPLGIRSLRKGEAIVRDELAAAGCAEVLLPALQPLDLWQRTGRDVGYGENLFKLRDRHGRQLVLGPTHEEIVTELVGSTVDSHRQLPLTLFQIQTKFRDEYRPRFGLLRVREFSMMDAYSFDRDAESLGRTYDRIYSAYERIFRRCGIPFVAVEAESGPIGGSASHEFMVLSESGEDTIVTSNTGNYSANLERADTGARAWNFGGEPSAELVKVHTPNLPGVDDVCRELGIAPSRMLKTLVFRTDNEGPPLESGANPGWLVAVVRGDHDVNEAKLARVARETFGVQRIWMEDTPAVRGKWAIGFCGPDKAVKDLDTAVVVDQDAAQGSIAWATGANETDYHVTNFNWFRECGDRLADPRKVLVADIRNALPGDPSPRGDGGVLETRKGIEIGHVFKLGTRYSEALDAGFKDESGAIRPLVMGCYGIGIGRLLVAAIETSHDERGIIWPAALAPFSCVITPVRYEGETKAIADRLYDELWRAGVDTLLDDRLETRPGAKFADADLIGIPVRITIGDRGLKEGKVELKLRTASEPQSVALDSAVSAVAAALATPAHRHG